MCARRSGNILFYFFADNFTGSKDTKPYKTDVSFFVSVYIAPEQGQTTLWGQNFDVNRNLSLCPFVAS